jgi:Protein of unknown function (DUF2950)
MSNKNEAAMNVERSAGRSDRMRRTALLMPLFAILVFAMTSAASAQRPFHSPQEAADALAGAARIGDRGIILGILGLDAADIVTSGDQVADAGERDRFVAAYDAKHEIAMEGDNKAVVLIGPDDFPFPIPLVRKNDMWQFDTAAGRQEILYRRIGRNELDAIQACLAYVDAQNEYAGRDRTGAGAGVYAQRIVSKAGTRDGLYWPAASENEDASPLGELFAEATREGYRAAAGRIPFHGYYYKILTKQGPNAPGGVLDYVVGGKMIGGFALVAYPASYGNSGVMTFLVNHTGVVYEKDLGPHSARIAERMSAFNPDQTWKKVVVPPL